jgi:outer membrane receptor protein involved in Fe transport
MALSFFNASLLSIGTFGDADQGDWLVSARRGNLDLIIDVVDPEFGSPDYQDYLAHVGWEFNSRAQVSANFLISDDKLSLVDADRGERATAAYSNQVGWLKWRAQWSESLSSDSILAISDIGNRRSGALALPGIVSGSLRENREFSALEIRQDWRWVAAETWMLRFGFNIKDLEAKYQLSSAKTLEPPFDTVLDNQPTTIREFDLAPSGVQYAAYTELRSRPFENWTFDVGLRWDQQNYTAVRNDKQYSPRLGILYQPAEHSELRLGWGQYYQAQEINELQVSDGITEFFRAQQAEHFVFNIKHQYDTGLNAEVSVYHKSFRRLKPRFENAFNSLTLLPELQFDRIMVDPSGAEATGAELLLSEGSAADDLLWWIGYTWSKIEDETITADVLRSWDQTHTLKGGLSWRWGQWDLSAAAEVHTGWPRTVMTGELAPRPDGSEDLILEVEDRNTSRYSTFHTLDIRVSREFDLARGDLTVFLDVTNVYDQQNRCCVEYSLRADGSLTSRNKHWLPMLPSLGIVWRF